MNILIGYASAHGSTAEIAHFMGRLLRSYGVDVTVSSVEDVQSVDSYDVVILGSAIHGGMWLQPMSLFFERCGAALASKPTYLFITTIRVLEPEGRQHCLQYYLHRPTLEQAGIALDRVEVFSGKLDVDSINWDERWLLASSYDGTEASKHNRHDYRDWQAIAAWTHGIAKALQIEPQFDK